MDLLWIYVMKIKVKINLPIFANGSVLDLCETFINEFYCDYVVPTWSKKMLTVYVMIFRVQYY